MGEQQQAIFFDRDGIVNRRKLDDYVRSPEEFAFLDDIFEVLASARAAGYFTVLVTNQRGIARGLMNVEALERIHEQMQRELAGRIGAGFDAIYFCPHGNDDGCDCRKPLPGMLVRAALDNGIDLESSWMIGDSESDIEAGIAAGCRTALVAPEGTASRADVVAGSLADAWRRISLLSLSNSIDP